MSNHASDHTLELLRKRIQEGIEDISLTIISNGCSDIEEYRHLTGRIKGLALAERELLELDQKLNPD